MSGISLAALKESLYMDATSPSGLRWRTDKRSGQHSQFLCRKAGDVAGGFSGYWHMTINYETVLCHRAIMCLLLDVEPDDLPFIDHENGDKSDNSVGNLKLSSAAKNSRNKKMASVNKSGKTGVFEWEDKRRGAWYVRAQWYDLEGNRHKKDYSVNVHGRCQAWEMAVTLREKMINQMNSQGAGYSERHGKVQND